MPELKGKTCPSSVFLIKRQIQPPKCLLKICALWGTFSEAQPRGPNELDWQKAGLKMSNRICVPSMSFALWAGLMEGPPLSCYPQNCHHGDDLPNVGGAPSLSHRVKSQRKCSYWVNLQGLGRQHFGSGVGVRDDDFLPSFSEISASFYGHDMATKPLRHGPCQVPWMRLLTVSKGGRVSWKSCSEGIRETQEYFNHGTREQSPEDFHPNRQFLLCIQAGACHTCSTAVFLSQGETWPRWGWERRDQPRP